MKTTIDLSRLQQIYDHFCAAPIKFLFIVRVRVEAKGEYYDRQ